MMGVEAQKLGLALLRAESEKEVQQIIAANSLMSNTRNWKPLDARETNFNIVTNQSSTGGKAATELITNMVDAMLTRRCLEAGIDPKGPDAPHTMYEAVDRFVEKLNGGRIVQADGNWLRNYAEKNLVIGITGKRRGGMPCYTFADNGEGQYPDDFPGTFLSFSARNKSDIPFVQGKYNMGSSGVLNFCGEEWFKLIISRRYDKTQNWGWTLIRKRPSSSPVVAEYFSPNGSAIPTLGSVDTLHPFQKDGKEINLFSLDSGTIVKLYDFYAGKNFRAFRGAREAFNENLVETILPFRILDFRWEPDPKRSTWRKLGIDARPFYGMEFLLLRSHAEELELEEDEQKAPAAAGNALPVGTIKDARLGKIVVIAIPLKPESQLPTWFKSSNNRVFHHVNGQVQLKKTRALLSQCKFSALKDRVVIIVDASKLRDSAHQSIWKGDRESIRETKTGEHYLQTVKDIITSSKDLKEWNYKVAKEALDSVAQESSRDLIRDLVKRDKNLALLLDGMYPDVAIEGPAPPKPSEEFEGKYSPTYVKFRDRKTEIEMAINRGRPVVCLTDAADDWLTRPDNQGDVIIEDSSVEESFVINRHLRSGNLTLFIKPDQERVKTGDKFPFRIGLEDSAMPFPKFTDAALTITITDEKEKREPRPRPPTPPSLPARGLPGYKLLTKDGRQLLNSETVKWEDASFLPGCSETDGGFVRDLNEDGKIYYINYDNASFQAYLRSAKQESEREAITQKYILGMRIMLLGLEHALISAPRQNGESDNHDWFRRLAAKGAASVALTLCDQLPRSFDLFGESEEISE